MKVFLTVMQLAGFVIPLVAAVVAYFRVKQVIPALEEGPKPSEYLLFAVDYVVPRLVKNQLDAVRGPAIVALSGLLLSTVAAIIPLWVQV